MSGQQHSSLPCRKSSRMSVRSGSKGRNQWSCRRMCRSDTELAVRICSAQRGKTVDRDRCAEIWVVKLIQTLASCSSCALVWSPPVSVQSPNRVARTSLLHRCPSSSCRRVPATAIVAGSQGRALHAPRPRKGTWSFGADCTAIPVPARLHTYLPRSSPVSSPAAKESAIVPIAWL